MFGEPSDFVGTVFVALIALGVGALGIAFVGLRHLAGDTRSGRIGLRLCLAGVVLFGAFIVQTLVEVARTGDVPDNFVLFGLGFLLLVIGHVTFARALRPALGRAWLLPLIAAGGALVAIAVTVDPVHDIGLFVFEGSWVALGWVLWRRPGLPVQPSPPAA